MAALDVWMWASVCVCLCLSFTCDYKSYQYIYMCELCVISSGDDHFGVGKQQKKLIIPKTIALYVNKPLTLRTSLKFSAFSVIASWVKTVDFMTKNADFLGILTDVYTRLLFKNGFVYSKDS